MSVESNAIDLASKYFTGQGYIVQNVSRTRGHNGYDLIVTRGAERLTIEVKGCSRAWQIPDLYVTEFNADRRLVADILCVVYFVDSTPPSICLIPRAAIPPELVVPKMGFKISSKFKKRSVLEQWCKPL